MSLLLFTLVRSDDCKQEATPGTREEGRATAHTDKEGEAKEKGEEATEKKNKGR